jgi:hypothetical protein
MTHLQSISARLLIAAALGAGVLLAPVTAMPEAAASTSADAAAPAPVGVTAASETSAVGLWQEFRVTGTATGHRAGQRVALQQHRQGNWTAVAAVAPITRQGTYTLRVKLGVKGMNMLRIAVGGAVSEPFAVTVR